jgi:hypothetical protein
VQFQDELAGGIVLIRPALQSPDYEAGVSGWSINQDGSAEFNNITIRGGAGVPAIIVGPEGEPQVIIYNNGANGVIEFPTGDPNESSPGRMASVVYDQGDPDERLSLEIQGPAHDVDDNRLAMQFNSTRADSSTPASVSIFDVASQNLIFFADNNRVQVNEALQVTPEDGDTNIPLFVDGNPGGGSSIAVIRRDGTNVLNIPNEGNLQVSPAVASALSALFINAPSGHTGRLLRAQLDGVDCFTVEPTGSVNAVGSLTTGNTAWGTAQTPAPGVGGGTSVVSVAFGKTFPATPRVTITPVTTVDPGTVTIRAYVDNVTTTGFDIRNFRSTNSATNFSWDAVSD